MITIILTIIVISVLLLVIIGFVENKKINKKLQEIEEQG